MIGDVLQTSFFQNRILDYLIVLAAFIVGFLLIRIIKSLVLKYLKSWAKRTAVTLDDIFIRIFEKTLLPLAYLCVFYLSIQHLTLNPTLNKIIEVLAIILLTVFGARFIVEIIRYTLRISWLKRESDETAERSFNGILTVIKVIIWGISIAFILDNLGFKISTVLAGLGIGGIAVALAAQAILGDLFSYFSILFDRPFEINDFVIVDDYLGTIENIGIKTTRIRSLSGEQVVFSNTDLTNSRLRNYKRMDKRRVLFRLGVVYQTSQKQLQEIPEIIKNIINNTADTVFDRVHFSSFGDFSLNFEIVYYVSSRDYNKYMDIQQEINFAIKEAFEKQQIEFAYPTQTLYSIKA
jgi:small-conductance mechanosensitive channel